MRPSLASQLTGLRPCRCPDCRPHAERTVGTRARADCALAPYLHAGGVELPWPRWLSELPEDATDNDAYELLDDRSRQYAEEMRADTGLCELSPRRLGLITAALDDGVDAVEMLLYGRCSALIIPTV